LFLFTFSTYCHTASSATPVLFHKSALRRDQPTIIRLHTFPRVSKKLPVTLVDPNKLKWMADKCRLRGECQRNSR
jgi:hypothetical protein